MKAKELYQSHRDAILAADVKVSTQGISDLIHDLLVDLQALQTARKPRTNSALVGMISEINQKYNAVVSLFEKNEGFTPIKPDGFRWYMEQEMPKLKYAFEQEIRRSPRDARLQPIPITSRYGRLAGLVR